MLVELLHLPPHLYGEPLHLLGLPLVASRKLAATVAAWNVWVWAALKTHATKVYHRWA